MSTLTEAEFASLQQQYEAQLSKPKKKPRQPYLVCPVGIVGAGKTTVMRPLAEKMALVRVSSDDIRKLLKDNGHSYEPVHDITYAIVTKLLTEGFAVALDADCLSRVENIEKLATEYTIPVMWLHVKPPEDYILHKLRNLEPNWLGTPLEMVANYYQQKPLHQQEFKLDFAYTFDPSQEDIAQQISNAARVIQQAVSERSQ